MEVRIGIRQVAREVVLESADSPEDVAAAIDRVVDGKDAVLRLTDDKGRVVLVPGEALGYVEIGSPDRSRVGFANR